MRKRSFAAAMALFLSLAATGAPVHVGVRGRIADGRAIRIAPDDTFQMTSGKKTRTGTVKQEYTRWAMNAGRADTLKLSETKYVTTSGTAAVKLPGTGVYRGGIQFTFSME